jgi:hypothetical protein
MASDLQELMIALYPNQPGVEESLETRINDVLNCFEELKEL